MERVESLYLVVPAYNEESSIESVIREWYPVLDGKGEDSRFIINCSGSTDGTVRIVESLRDAFPKLRLYQGSENTYGAKVLDLYQYAVANGADYVFQTDSDGQTNPAEFQAFWDLRDEYDVVIGQRTVREDGWIRMAVQKVVVGLLKLYFHIDVPDANTPFRLMKASVLKRYLDVIPQAYSMPNILLTAMFVAGGEQVSFPAISFEARRGGKNVMNLRKIFRIGIESLRVFRNLGRQFRQKQHS